MSSGLGRGLGSLISKKPTADSPAPSQGGQATITGIPAPHELPSIAPSPAPTLLQAGSVSELPIELVDPNPFQPRNAFNETHLQELVDSIKIYGVIQPVLVTQKGDRYELIAGERRLRASKLAGKQTIPAIVKTHDDLAKLEIALIENIQRQDLNPVEEAEGVQNMMNAFHMTQEDVAHKLGKSRSYVTNCLRVLSLPSDMRDALSQGIISRSHAVLLLSLTNPIEQKKLFDAIIAGSLSVKATESLIKKENIPTKQPKIFDPDIAEKESMIREKIDAPVAISSKKGKGTITIHFYTEEDLNAIITRILE